MKTILLRLLACVVLAAAWFVINPYLDHLEELSVQPVRFQFRLPLPEKIRKKYKLQLPLTNVQKVVLAGRFSDWKADDDLYTMRGNARQGWHLSLHLGPGRHPYKFVIIPEPGVHLPPWAEGRIWCEDFKADDFEEDGYGGRNSVYTVPDLRVARDLFNFLVPGLFFGIIAFSILIFLIRILMRMHLSLRAKLVIVFLVLLLASNLLFLAFIGSRQQKNIMRIQADQINMFHNFLLAMDVDFTGLSQATNTAVVSNAFGRYFRHVSLRQDFNLFSNSKQTIFRVFLLDKQGRIIHYQMEGNREKMMLARLRHSLIFMNQYYRDKVEQFLVLYRKNSKHPQHPRPFFFYYDDHPHPSYPIDSNQELIGEYGSKTAFFRYDSCFYPIYHGGRLRGYYLFHFHPESYAVLFRELFYYNLLLLALLALLYLFLIRRVGSVILNPLNDLIGWTEAIMEGDFAVEKDVQTGDEIGDLSRNFDRMRKSLQNNLDRLTLINRVSEHLQRIMRVPDLYHVFLTIVTANFGLGFNRAAVFLQEGETLRGHYAVGCLDQEELEDTFGSLDDYQTFELSLESLNEPLPEQVCGEENRFQQAVRRLSIPLDMPSRFTAVFQGKHHAILQHSDEAENAVDKMVGHTLGLQHYLLLPIPMRHKNVGLLLVDRLFDGGEITAADVNQLRILLSQFSANLENAMLIADLEQTVAKRTADLQQANERLQEMDRVKTLFFTNVSHETKTPLTLIRNYLQRYIERTGLDDDLRVIKQNIDKLQRDMVNLLDAEKLKRGQVFYKHDQIIDVEDLLRKKVTVFREIAARKQLDITTVLENGLYVKADPFAMDRIVNNLLDNAIKYTEIGGRIEVALDRDGEQALLRFRDTGIGMDAEQQAHVFEPYHQISHRKRNLQGIGMGLFIVHKIVESLAGNISIESKPGTGSEFLIRLPLYQPAAGEKVGMPFHVSSPIDIMPAVSEMPKEEFDKTHYNILFVEDNIELLQFVQSSLHAHYNMYYALNGEGALERLRKIPKPDVIVSDVMMDGMDGFTLFQELAADEKYRDIPFIFLSARATTDDRLAGLREGAIDYIYKPFTIEELSAKINAILRNAQLRHKVYEMDKFASIGRLVAAISHEIFNPLSGVRGPLDYLKRELSTQLPQHEQSLDEAFGHVFRNLERIEDIVRSLRVLYSTRKLARDDVDLPTLVDSVLTLLRPKADAGITFQVKIRKSLSLHTNHDALTHILINLISNAVDAIDGKGNVTISAQKKNNKATISVADTGKGIPADQIDNIFNMFFTTKQQGAGMGLGLHIVKELAEKTGWKISVSSTEGKGTEFILQENTARSRNG